MIFLWMEASINPQWTPKEYVGKACGNKHKMIHSDAVRVAEPMWTPQKDDFSRRTT